jgi:hypothetical protein
MSGISNIGVLNERIFPVSGLQSYWRFNETSGTAVPDVVGGKNGIISGTTVSYSWGAGKNNNALTTSNVTTGIFCGKTTYAYERTQAWSCSLWFKRTAAAGTIFFHFSKSLSYALGYEAYFDTTDKLIFHITNTTTSNEIKTQTTQTFTDTTNFHHYVYTYAGNSNTSGMHFYYDGAEVTLNSLVNNLTATIIDTTASFMIGCRFNGSTTNYGKGIFDEMGWWNVVLTLQQVKDIYNLGTGIFY